MKSKELARRELKTLRPLLEEYQEIAKEYEDLSGYYIDKYLNNEEEEKEEYYNKKKDKLILIYIALGERIVSIQQEIRDYEDALDLKEED